MTHEETVLLTRYVRACCPHQAIDDYTPDAWHDILGHLDLADCRAAVVAIKQRARYVDPCDIIAELDARKRGNLPHSEACRARDCRDCVWSWCNCTCHERLVTAAPGALAIRAAS